MIDGGLSALFQKRMPDFHWTRIETGGTGRGIPDLAFVHQGTYGWLENKVTSGWKVGLSPEQVAWALRHQRAGGRTFVAVRRKADAGPRRGKAVDSLYLYQGIFVRELATMGLRCPLFLLHTPGGPARWDWTAVRDVLLSTP